MDYIEKLFRRISKNDRQRLNTIILILKNPNARKKLAFAKLQDSDFYKLRKGNFRIIFHFESSGVVIVDAVRYRNEKTYRDF